MRSVLRRLLDQAGFSPRQLFAALQGAWLEPKQGLIWQENTGVTPTTTGGQTIGLLLDQSQGAVLGPELVTNGTFDSADNWTLGAGWSIAGGVAVATSAAIGSLLTNTGQVVAGLFYKVSYTVVTSSDSNGVSFQGGTSPSGVITQGLGNVGTFIEYFQAVTTGSICMRIRVGVHSGSIDNISVRQILGNHAYQPTAANRPLLGRRYNLLTYSEDFSNAAWVKQNGASVNTNAAAAPDGSTTAVRVNIPNKNSDYFYQNINVAAASYTISFWAKVESGTATFTIADSSAGTLTLTTAWTYYSATIAHVGGSINIYPAMLNANGSFLFWHPDVRLTSNVGKDPAYQRITTATDYDYGQYPAVIHDTNDSLTLSLPNLGGGVFSASGSVYFATPVGMSQLNNQSMGQTYTLPALSSDIYAWMVFPQRLNAAQENRLSRYFERKAGIAGPDYLTSDAALLDQLTDDSGEQLLLAQ